MRDHALPAKFMFSVFNELNVATPNFPQTVNDGTDHLPTGKFCKLSMISGHIFFQSESTNNQAILKYCEEKFPDGNNIEIGRCYCFLSVRLFAISIGYFGA